MTRYTERAIVVRLDNMYSTKLSPMAIFLGVKALLRLETDEVKLANNLYHYFDMILTKRSLGSLLSSEQTQNFVESDEGRRLRADFSDEDLKSQLFYYLNSVGRTESQKNKAVMFQTWFVTDNELIMQAIEKFKKVRFDNVSFDNDSEIELHEFNDKDKEAFYENAQSVLTDDSPITTATH